MTIEGLGFLNEKLESLGIPYEYMEWTSSVPRTYFVGEYTETVQGDEGGEIDSDFILTGTTKNKYYNLELVKQQVQEAFPPEGLTAILDNGWGIAIMYSGAMPIPSIQEGIHRIQITLQVKEWKGV